LGGFAGGAADNWVVFRRIKSVVGTSILFTIAFGRERARRIGSRVAKHFSGVVASVALGVLLGMTPAICSIFHLPLDVRHVTLSSGSIAAAVSTLGPSALVTWSFWSAVIGVFFIGVMNLTFSFAFAMRLALSARSVRGAQLGVILRAIFRRLRTKPWTFVLPIGLPLLIEVSASDRPSTSEL
jgi:site-specific recombinase